MKTKFYTGKGDKGKSEIGKKKISKDDVLFDVLGSIDELNSWIGFCGVEAEKFSKKNRKKAVNVFSVLKDIQETLFIAQAEIASVGFGYPVKNKVSLQKTKSLEEVIKKIDKDFPKLENFIIPGGSELASRLDLARTVVRNTERHIVRLNKKKKLSNNLLQFFNRLSSVLFALARYVNYCLGIKEENPNYL